MYISVMQLRSNMMHVSMTIYSECFFIFMFYLGIWLRGEIKLWRSKIVVYMKQHISISTCINLNKAQIYLEEAVFRLVHRRVQPPEDEK